MMKVTSDLSSRIASSGYADSDYDRMENYLTITNEILTADYEDDMHLLPNFDEAPWCPDEVIQFLKDNKV